MTQQTVGSFAVIGSDGVYLSEGGRMALPAFQQLAYWLDAMSRRHIETLWLHPSMGWRWRDADIDACDPWVIDGSGGEAGDPYWTATRTGAYGVKRIIQPLWEDRAPWHASPDAARLRDSLLTFRAAVGFDWWRGPGANGTRLLRTLHSGAHATKLELPGDPPPPAKDGLASDTGHLHWVRPLAEHERGGYLQSYDVNGQYLAACNGLKLGVGQAQHHTRTELPDKLTDWPAGYFRVRRAEKAKKGPCPDILTNDTTSWVTTPTLRLLHEQGATLHIVESWTWAESKRYLDPWYKALRQARVMCGDDPVALGAIKAMYKHPITWMASTKWDRTGDTLYRPDWYHLITAQARAGVLRTVYRVGGAYDIWPLAVGSDCVYYVTPTPDPVAPFVTPLCGGSIAPTDGVRLSPALGQYKVKDAGVPVSEIAPLLRGKQWNLTALQEALNKRRAHSAVGAA